jgi:steroid delta-isomerase-like uncharacterized protein
MTSPDATRALVERYYAAFNAGDTAAMADLVSDDLVHDVNQGERRTGRDAFIAFNAHMTRCYRETLSDMVIMVSDDGRRAAAEFVVHGEYLATDEGLPPATGQRYVLPAGAFVAVEDGRIARITTCYNLADWMRQVTSA